MTIVVTGLEDEGENLRVHGTDPDEERNVHVEATIDPVSFLNEKRGRSRKDDESLTNVASFMRRQMD